MELRGVDVSSGSLRAQLGVQADPDFTLDLPPGWTRTPVEEAAMERMLTGMRRRLMAAQQPQAYAEMRELLKQAFEEMRRNGAFAFFSAADPDPDTLWIPASMVASIRRADPGETLDELARTLIRSHGATPLFGDKRTLRFEKEETVRLGTETLVNHSVIYLIPIPGAQRRRALQIVASFGRTLDVPADSPAVKSMTFLFDSSVATLRWRTPESA